MIHPRAATRPGRLAAATAALALAASLAGCITLFPKEKPVQLYRFDAATPQVQPATRTFGVRTSMSDFDPAAAGDRIMTVDGDQVAYVAEGRWSSPANQLFDEAVAHGFAAPGDAARLVGSTGKAEYRLKLVVTRFEARYPSGPTSAPTVVVVVRAALDRQSDLSNVDTKEFKAEINATDNRVGPIVQAFDQATTQVVGELVGWVDEKGGG
ncbi:MAG TPA: ABC-type transport auxiliary lipoprotein family protein [Caulobacteraceae bacterium]|jgi:cholesterol transport system auxiliary component|nr:ABC-type transport auxiliary lipoprotein family protein [Caulobacteraceae bacterium]